MPDTELPVEPPAELPAPDIEPLKRPPVEVSDQHREAFFKAFMADKPYTEEFALMGGHYKVVFKSLSMKENRDLLKQFAYDRDAGRIEGANDYYFSRINHYRLSLSLVSINDLPFAEDITAEKVKDDKKEGTSYLTARADLFNDWTMVKLAAVQAALTEFDQRVLTLVDAVSKPDFWKAAA